MSVTLYTVQSFAVHYPGDLLLLLFLHSQEAGAVDGNHNFLQRCQQILLLLPLAGGQIQKHITEGIHGNLLVP